MLTHSPLHGVSDHHHPFHLLGLVTKVEGIDRVEALEAFGPDALDKLGPGIRAHFVRDADADVHASLKREREIERSNHPKDVLENHQLHIIRKVKTEF